MIFCTIAGRLGRDAELRDANGTPVLSMAVACDVGRDKTQWVQASLFGKRASGLAQYCTKGTRVTCVGALTMTEREGKAYLNCNASEITLQGFNEAAKEARAEAPHRHAPSGKPSSANNYGRTNKPGLAAEYQAPAADPIDSDEIPF